MRLIDADALGVCKVNPDDFVEKAYAWGWNNAIEIIEKAPAVDAVPVVRCRECKYSQDLNNQEGEIYLDVCRVCKNQEASQDGYMVVMPDHFCSYGERRETNDKKAD